MKKLLVTLFIIIAVSAACSEQKPSPENAADHRSRQSIEDTKASGLTDEVRTELMKTVKRYTRALADGYRDMNMDNLFLVASKEQVEKVANFMFTLGQSSIRMDSTLKNIEFKDIRLDTEGHGFVRTTEIWDYAHVNINDESVTREEKDVQYDLQYELQKSSHGWIVADISMEGGENTTASDAVEK